jgi:Flp pilus assembly protein TadB
VSAPSEPRGERPEGPVDRFRRSVQESSATWWLVYIVFYGAMFALALVLGQPALVVIVVVWAAIVLVVRVVRLVRGTRTAPEGRAGDRRDSGDS